MGRSRLCYLMNGLNLMKGGRLGPKGRNDRCCIVKISESVKKLIPEEESTMSS